MPGEPKEMKNSVLYNYFQAFASDKYIEEVNKMFSDGNADDDILAENYENGERSFTDNEEL